MPGCCVFGRALRYISPELGQQNLRLLIKHLPERLPYIRLKTLLQAHHNLRVQRTAICLGGLLQPVIKRSRQAKLRSEFIVFHARQLNSNGQAGIVTPCHYRSRNVNYFLSPPDVSQNDEYFINNNNVMSNKIDMDAVREIANHLAGTLDALANLHATVAVHDRESKAIASTFALLHERAASLERLLSEH